ncbi:hypothetical protein EJB05_22423 [Eragrostis curvula]|uniref:Uncharacterized protein n=1 Tax=Eragrostis curvula TaxID=38414 RepID=A0A5J9V4A1_9POAL|nr:hypothetical protein EJB05_22423 [Eragrostis curvula]
MVLKLNRFVREVEDGLKITARFVLPSGMPPSCPARVLTAVAMIMVVGDKFFHRFEIDSEEEALVPSINSIFVFSLALVKHEVTL